MEQRFLIDTNVLVDVLGNAMPDNVKRKVLQMSPIISVVTYMEAMGWYQATSTQLRIIKKFMDVATILPINQPVIEATVLIRQQKKISLGDAIIAATAIVNNHVLVTRNVSDFGYIDNLMVFNPWEN